MCLSMSYYTEELRVQKATQEVHQVTYKGKRNRVSADLSVEALKARKHPLVNFKLSHNLTTNQDYNI